MKLLTLNHYTDPAMQNRIIIEICLGSSCFSRGNGKTLKSIQNYLKQHQLDNQVVLKGNHCFNDCSKGPVVKIGDEIHEDVNSENILIILDDNFNQNKNDSSIKD